MTTDDREARCTLCQDSRCRVFCCTLCRSCYRKLRAAGLPMPTRRDDRARRSVAQQKRRVREWVARLSAGRRELLLTVLLATSSDRGGGERGGT